MLGSIFGGAAHACYHPETGAAKVRNVNWKVDREPSLQLSSPAMPVQLALAFPPVVSVMRLRLGNI